MRTFEDMTLVEVVASGLNGRSMTQAELTVTILEAGYETSMENTFCSFSSNLFDDSDT
jgi:hypothetical protein